MENREIIVADLNTLSVWNFAKDQKEAEEILNRANAQVKESIETWKRHIEDYPNREDFKTYLKQEECKNYQIMFYDDYAKAERNTMLSGKPKRITKARFFEMLEVLPPLKWCTIDGVEMFCISEMYSGSYTNQYALDKTTNKYYTKMVDCRDKTTWINTQLRSK